MIVAYVVPGFVLHGFIYALMAALIFGLVNSTLGSGPPVDSFDPVLTGSLGIQHATTPQTNLLLSGVPSLVQGTGTANFGYAQGFPTGTLLNITFNNSRVTTNSTRSLLVPQLNSN